MSGAAYDLFHVKEVFRGAPWDAEAARQQENNIKIVPRARLSAAFPIIAWKQSTEVKGC